MQKFVTHPCTHKTQMFLQPFICLIDSKATCHVQMCWCFWAKIYIVTFFGNFNSLPFPFSLLIFSQSPMSWAELLHERKHCNDTFIELSPQLPPWAQWESSRDPPIYFYFYFCTCSYSSPLPGAQCANFFLCTESEPYCNILKQFDILPQSGVPSPASPTPTPPPTACCAPYVVTRGGWVGAVLVGRGG